MISARDRKGGFTLLEGVFSMFLIFLVLGALVFTLRQAGSVKSNFTNMGELSELVQVISLFRADIGAALEFETPGLGGRAKQLSLRRIDPELLILDRITPLPLTNLDDPDLDAFEPDETAQVEYFLAEGLLKRRNRNAAGQSWVEQLIDCQELEVEHQRSPPQMTVTLQLKNSRRSREHTLKVALR